MATTPAASQQEASGQERGDGAVAQVVDEEPPAGPGQIMSAAQASKSHDLDEAVDTC